MINIVWPCVVAVAIVVLAVVLWPRRKGVTAPLLLGSQPGYGMGASPSRAPYKDAPESYTGDFQGAAGGVKLASPLRK